MWAVPRIRSLVAGLTSRMHDFDPKELCLGYGANKVATGHFVSEYFEFHPSMSFYQFPILSTFYRRCTITETDSDVK